MNILMFLSLFLSMMSVVMSALIRQWCREFMKYAYPRAPPHKRGRVRTYLYQGLDHSQMRRFMYGVHVLLHVSIFLFFWAVSDFLYNFSEPVGTVARYCVITFLVVYTAISISPLIFFSSPYHTALTPPLRGGVALILFTIRNVGGFLPGFSMPSCSFLEYFKGIRFDRAHFLVKQANSRAGELDHYAMRWLFKEDDFSDDSMDTFLEALPGYIHSHLTENPRLAVHLTASYITKRIRGHLLTCATSYWLSDEACITRVSGCVNSLRLIFKTSGTYPSSEDKERSKKNYIQGLIKGLNGLCEGEDKRVALRASCVRGLAFQGLVSHLTTPDQPFPGHLEPLYSFICDEDNRESTRQPGNVALSTETRNNQRSDENKTKWETLLHDGPLVNLTLLAQAILSHERHEHIHPESLSLCWKALETLLMEFSIARMNVSEPTLKQFNKVLEDAREHVQANHRGFRVTPLVETLDTVARGWRLSMVFLGHPKYYGRADVVFGKDQLRNSDLMEAFASCLPGYISAISPERRRDFMERMVCDDGLWTSLQVNLWNTVQLEIPIPDKLRIFEACCIVIDAMFFALEDSNKVDWRAPDFGSLAQHFEIFVANCFQGIFVGRATGFRVGLIKLRFCEAVLAKFHEEIRSTGGAVSLRSQWDVASLARVFFTLEVGTDEDVVFWKSFTDGGHIDAEFMIKLRDMLDTAIRDGPLLNFCKLGHLVVTAVPFAGSGLELADIEKVRALQRKLLRDEQLPLKRASAEVWKELSRLRGEVDNVLKRSSDKEKDMLDRLLQMIDHAINHNPYSPQQLPPSPTERSAHTSSRDDGSSPHDPLCTRTTVSNRITSRVVNQIPVGPQPTSPVHPRFSCNREVSRHSTMPTYFNLPTRRESSRITTDAGSLPPTRVLTGNATQPSTFSEEPEPILPDASMGPLQGSPGSSDDGLPISAVAIATDGNLNA